VNAAAPKPPSTTAHVLSKLSGARVALDVIDWDHEQIKVAMLLDRIVEGVEKLVGCTHSPAWLVPATRTWCAACGTLVDTPVGSADPFIVRDLRRYLEALREIVLVQP
jgi:hypothetical protein